jgi:hypothetical protein
MVEGANKKEVKRARETTMASEEICVKKNVCTFFAYSDRFLSRFGEDMQYPVSLPEKGKS